MNTNYQRDIKEIFENPSKFLSLNPKMVIGILPNINKNTKSNYKKSNSLNQVNNTTEKEKETNYLTSKDIKSSETNDKTKSISKMLLKDRIRKTRIKTNKNISYIQKNFNLYENLINHSFSSGIHYQLKTKNELYDIFKKSKLREKEFLLKGTNELIPSSVTDDIKEDFEYQEKILKLQNRDKILNKIISKKLSKSCQRDEKDLLYNNIEEYRLKKQMIDVLDNEKPISEKYGNNYWMFNLRRPKKLDYVRVNYINVGTNEREIWKPVLEFPFKPVEIILNPKSLVQNKYSNVINQNYFCNETKRLNFKIPNMNEINQITLQGKNLIKEEINNLNLLYQDIHSDKVRLFKDPFEEKKNCMNDLICKQNYEKPNLQICRCTLKSAKTVKKKNKQSSARTYYY
jgi:hypothetical protein